MVDKKNQLSFISELLQMGYHAVQSRGLSAYSMIQRKILNNTGTEVLNEDWDNLIILDGCRYDLFEEVNTIDGKLESRISMGSSTPEFLTNNFEGDNFYDTVYVCAIPMIEQQGVHNHFFDTIRVWKSRWDSDIKTVPPSAMADEVQKATEQYPNKRIIGHFLQPHYPFIGPTGQKIPHPTIEGPGLSDREDHAPKYVWTQLQEGSISHEMAWKAYRENLEIALPYVKSLIKSLIGKTVVTSDHGNGFGEWGVYGHPTHRTLYLEELIKVPWLIINNGERKTITEGDEHKGSQAKSEDIKHQLQALGYAE